MLMLEYAKRRMGRGKIITLDEGTVKKIAAGEVVENPAR